MKAIKYLVVGALISISAPAMAQTDDFGAALAPVSQALKDNPAAAEGLAKSYMKQYKKNPEALIALGNSYLAVKNFDKATNVANMALTAAKKNLKYQAEAYILLGDIEAVKDEAGNGGNAASHYATAKSLDPKNPIGYMRYASIYRKINPDLVEKTYAELLENIPGYPIHAEAGSSFFSGNKFDKAFENYAKCDINSLDEGNMVKYLISAVQLRKYAEAYNIATAGMNKFPKNVTLNQLGLWSAVETEKFDDAINIAQKFLALEGDKNATDYTYYGKALFGAKRYEDAIKQFEEAMNADEKVVEPLQRISECYAAKGDADKALEYSEKYMQKNPNATPSDYAKMAQIYVAKAEQGVDKAANFKKAIGIYDKMAEKYPSIASWAHMIAAGVADKSGDTALGASYNEKIVSALWNKADRDADETSYLTQALRLLGFYYWSDKNDLESAKPYYEKLIQLEPNDKNAKAALGIEE